MGHQKVSIYLSRLLRHDPDSLGLHMDSHGWVDAAELIDAINQKSRYSITRELLERIVAEDNKGRYRFSDDGCRIKACQGHSIPWVEPELCYCAPPAVLYHGTTREAWVLIQSSGGLSKMKRHAVHLQPEPERAWQSARRWKKTPVVLAIDAEKMAADGYRFGVSDNGVWCTERVPLEYIEGQLAEE